MTGTQRTSEGLDPRRRRVLIRSWRRGMREMDLLLGGYADERIGDMTDAELDDFEALMEAPDGDLLNWFTGKVDVPENYDTQVYRDISAFHARKADQTH